MVKKKAKAVKKKAKPKKAAPKKRAPKKAKRLPPAKAGRLRIQLKENKQRCVAQIRIGDLVEQINDGRVLEGNFTAAEHRQARKVWGHIIDIEHLGKAVKA